MLTRDNYSSSSVVSEDGGRRRVDGNIVADLSSRVSQFGWGESVTRDADGVTTSHEVSSGLVVRLPSDWMNESLCVFAV